jgi:malate dehydrogenase (oxaloacetate-decarboxylating)(NADP+)
VAAACDAIVEDPAEAASLTSRSNLIGVVTNGTAVLGSATSARWPPSR